MKTEAISITVFRKKDQLFVTPWALSTIGFQCLDDVFAAKPEVPALVAALELSAARAREASLIPRDRRSWKARTIASWSQLNRQV